MGVSIEIYRMRIGLFSHRGRHPFREKEYMVQMKPATSGHPWRLYLVALYIILCYAALIIRLMHLRNDEDVSQNKGVTTITSSTPQSDTSSVFTWEHDVSRGVWQTGMSDTFMGGDIWRQVTAIGVVLLRFAGDVEENPGPPNIDLKSVVDLQIETVTETQIMVKWKDPYKAGFSVAAIKSRLKETLGWSKKTDSYWFEAVIKANEKVVETLQSNSDCPQAVFEDLRAYTDYEVSVTVVTEGSGQSKPEVRKIRTDIGAPRNVTAEADGPTKIKVSWEHPDPMPTQYILAVCKVEDGKTLPGYDDMPLLRKTKNYTLISLREGTTYSISIGSKTGTSKNFCQSVICHTALLLPENITTYIDNDVIKVSWTKRQDHLEDKGIKYKICLQREEGIMVHTDTVKGKSCNIVNLVPASNYTVQLSTVKDEDMESEAWTTQLSTRPVKVKGARLLATTETSVTLSWDAVECDHYLLHPEEITNHTSQNTPLPPIKAARSQEWSFEIKDLKSGTPYVIGIEANFKGNVSEKKDITVMTKPEAPITPMVEFNDTKMLLKWTGPKSLTQSLVYDVELVDSKGKMVNSRPFRCKEPFCEVDDLQESWHYDVAVYTVVEHQQNEKRSRPLKTTVKIPLQGVGFKVSTKTENSITVHWARDQSGPSAPLLQYRTFARLGNTVKWYKKHGAEDNERTFDNLDMGTTYTVGICKGTGGDWSDPEEKDVTTDLPPPFNIQVAHTQCNSVRLTWEVGYNADVFVVEWWEKGKEDQRQKDTYKHPNETTLENLQPGTTYGVELSAIRLSVQSRSSSREIATRPMQPEKLTLKSDVNEIKASWDKPECGGVDNYESTLFDLTSETVVKKFTENGTTATITGLSPGTKYKLCITANYRAIFGDPKEECVVTKPQPITSISIDEVTSNSASVSWQPPQDPTGVIGYRLHCTAASQTRAEYKNIGPVDVWTKEGKEIPCSRVFQKLMPNTKYKITVMSMAGSREEPVLSPSTSEDVTTEIQTVTGLRVAFYDTTYISISWEAVKGWWSDPKIRVHISPSGPNEKWKKPDDLPGGTSTKRFENLRPATNYTIRVAVLEWGGTEGKKATITCATRPRPISSISVTEQTTTVIKVKWVAAIDNNVTYLAQIADKDPVSVGKDLEYAFDELDPGTSYDISIIVKRTFEDGREVESRPLDTKAFTCPAHPENFHVKTCSPNSIAVAWQPPVGNIDCYKVDIWCKDQTNSRSDEQEPEQRRTIDKGSTECVFDSLSTNPGSLHRITISSHFQNLSSDIAEITQRTKVCSPDLKLREKTETSITISWEHVKGEKEKYVLSLSPSEGEFDVEIPCHENRLQYTFRNLVAGKEYNVSAITIYEDVECEPHVLTVRTVVSPPRNLTVIKQSTTTHSFMVSWEKSVGEIDGYVQVLRYGPQKVETMKANQTGEISRKISASSHEYLFENLTPGRLYTISLCTYVGDSGSTSIPITVQERTLVASAKAVRVSYFTHSSVSFTWDDADGDVDYYEYCVMHGEVHVKTNVTELSNQRPVQVDDLTGGCLYQLLVVAVSGSRKSQPTWTTHRTKVHKPEGLEIVNVKNQQVTITWEQAHGDKDKYTAAIFDTTFEDRAPKCIGDVSASASALEYRFSALVPGRGYEIAIRTNSGGETSEPDTRLIRTLPLRPVNVRTSTVDTGIMVEWLEPSGDKDEYSLEIYPNENLQSPVLISSGNKTSHTFTGVTLGKHYDIKISTRSKDVESAKVVRQQRMTVGPPNLVPPQPFETSLKVTWDHAEGEKDRYHITIWDVGESTCVRKDVRNTDEDLEITFEPLVSGRLYRVEVTTESGGEFSECVHETVRTKIRPPTEIIIADNDVKENSIRITWPEPYCDKDRYHVLIAPKDGVENPVGVVEKGQTLEYTFQKLTSGRKHQLSVWTDSGGDKSDPVTAIKRTTVSPIEQISIGERTENTLTITWRDAKGDRSSYIAFISEMNSEMPLQHFPNIRARSLSQPYSQTFTNLTPGRMYEVSVVTVSGEMESLPRNMPFRTIVSPPRNVKIPQDSVTEHSMDVVWEDARGDWESYEHNISPNEGFARHIGKESLDGAVVYRSTFENLVAGKIYRIGMFTRNKEADSEVVLLEGKRTKVAAVDENSIVFTNVSENAVTLEWKQAVGEKDIYRVTIHPSSEDTAVVKSPSAEIKADDELLHTFVDLTPGQKYTISIVTFKENDTSSEATKTIHTKPNMPERFRVETFAESIAVSWDSPVGVQDEYMVEIRTVPEDPEWFIKATFAEKTEPPNDEGAGITDESTETRPWQSFKYTFREKGIIKARTKYKISAQTKSGKKQSGGQFSHVVSKEERTKPHPPRDPRLVKEGIESVTFSWAPPIDEVQKRDIHRYIVKYKGPDEEDEREHDCQFNTSAKIEHLRDNTEYDFFVISVVETTTEDGKQERVDSESCRFTFKTMSQSTKIVRKFSKKMKQALFIVICGGAFVISLFTFLGVFVHNCVRPFDQSEVDSATVIPSTNVSNTPSVTPTTNSAQSYNNRLRKCFIEKAGEQFWYFVFFTAVPAICLLAILLWKVVKRVRKNITRATDGEKLRLLEESSIEMTDLHSDEDKPRLEYGKKTTRQRWLINSS